MNKDLKITYTNANGKSIILGAFAPFRLMNYSGFGLPENEITSEKVYGMDGELKIHSSLSYRDLQTDVLIQGKDFEEKQKYKRNLMAVLNPKLLGTLRIDILEKAYEIDVEIIKGFDPQYEKGAVQYRALDPFWRDISLLDYTVQLGEMTNLFEFPLNITDKFEFATITSGKEVEITNTGDVPIGLILNITCTAEVVNPKFLNLYTQEFFAFNHTFTAGDTIFVNTNHGKKQVLINGENGFFMRKLGSTFIQLDNLQTNYFILQADDGVENMLATMKYSPLLTGV